MEMNRRTFLKTLGIAPALTIVPSILLAEEIVPEFLEIPVTLNHFGNRVPKFIFRAYGYELPAYITEVDPIIEHIIHIPAGHLSIKYPAGYFTEYKYTTTVKLLNTIKAKQSDIKTISINDYILITV